MNIQPLQDAATALEARGRNTRLTSKERRLMNTLAARVRARIAPYVTEERWLTDEERLDILTRGRDGWTEPEPCGNIDSREMHASLDAAIRRHNIKTVSRVMSPGRRSENP